MEIPRVSLIDGHARKIGVFNDDTEWWQSIKQKYRMNMSPRDQITSHQQLKIENELTKGTPTPPGSIEISDMTGSQVRLIDNQFDTKSQKKQIKMSVDNTVANVVMDERERERLKLLADNSKQIGETPLHVAIMHDDLVTIKYLVEEKGIDVNQRTTEGVFISGFEKYAKSIEKSQYSNLAYYGEYPLSFAACFANKEIYDYLIDKGADPNLIDSNGNAMLHTLVINDKLEMLMYASNHPVKKAELKTKNAQGLSPFNLAAKLARSEIFTKMLEVNEITIWQYSNVICSVYPLDSIDTILPDGSIDGTAALGFIVNGETDTHLEMLRIGFIDRLLEDKWATFAQLLFIKKMVISLFHLIFLSIAVYCRAGDYPYVAISPTSNGNTIARYFFEMLTFLGCIGILVVQAKELHKQGAKEYLHNMIGEPANVFYNLFCILVILAFPWRFVTLGTTEGSITARNVEDTFVILAIPCAWMHLLFYARVMTLTGPFVVMIYKMIIGDILTFTTIFIMFLFGFSLGFYYLYKDAGETVTTLHSYEEALFQTFLWTLGEYKSRLPEFDRVLNSDLLKVIFVVFMIFLHIILFNMLIAMMGNTYAIINAKSEKEWRKQWAHSILLLEQSFSAAELNNFQNKYCMQMPDPDPTKPDKSVLMVIKKLPTTKPMVNAKTKKNWKLSTKAVRDKLRFYNCKGVDLLDLWANKSFKIGARKPVDWSLYGGAPKNRPALKKPEDTNSGPKVVKEVKPGPKPTPVTKPQSPVPKPMTPVDDTNIEDV